MDNKEMQLKQSNSNIRNDDCCRFSDARLKFLAFSWEGSEHCQVISAERRKPPDPPLHLCFFISSLNIHRSEHACVSKINSHAKGMQKTEMMMVNHWKFREKYEQNEKLQYINFGATSCFHHSSQFLRLSRTSFLIFPTDAPWKCSSTWSTVDWWVISPARRSFFRR